LRVCRKKFAGTCCASNVTWCSGRVRWEELGWTCNSCEKEQLHAILTRNSRKMNLKEDRQICRIILKCHWNYSGWCEMKFCATNINSVLHFISHKNWDTHFKLFYLFAE
jgi:hypothetical protein